MLNLYLSTSKSTALKIHSKKYKYPKKLLNYSNVSSCNSLPPPLPKSNGKIEIFHRYLKKALKAAKSEGRNWREELSKIVLAYRSTPHRASGETPANLMFGRDVRTKLPSLVTDKRDTKDIESHHKSYKEKIKQYADMTNRAKEHNFKLGDIVYVASMEDGKLDSKYRDTRYILLKHTSDISFEMVKFRNLGPDNRIDEAGMAGL